MPSFLVVERNLERLQKPDVLRRHLEPGLVPPLFESLLVHLDVQRFQKAPVIGCDLGGLRLASRQSDGGVEFQHNVVAGGANSCDGLRNAIRLGDRVIDGVPQFPKQALEVIVKLQGASSRSGSVWHCRPLLRWKQASASESVPALSDFARSSVCDKMPPWAVALRVRRNVAVFSACCGARPGKYSTKRQERCSSYWLFPGQMRRCAYGGRDCPPGCGPPARALPLS